MHTKFAMVHSIYQLPAALTCPCKQSGALPASEVLLHPQVCPSLAGCPELCNSDDVVEGEPAGYRQAKHLGSCCTYAITARAPVVPMARLLFSDPLYPCCVQHLQVFGGV